MQENKYWFKFILTGKPQDYINYKNNCKQQAMYGGEVYGHNNRWPSDKRNEYKG